MSSLLHIICYIIYTTLTSTIFSLLLGFRLLRRRIFPSSAASKDARNVVALYEGTLNHVRRYPTHNSFRFSTRYALIDLDRPPYSPPTYLSADDARRAAKTNGPVFLLTTLPSLGYRSSPASFYYCYDIEGSTKTFKKCIVESTNTPWGETVTFVFNPTSDLVPKCQHISPFMDMRGLWKLSASGPGEDLYAYISVQHPDYGNKYLVATLKAKRVSVSSATLDDLDLEVFFWLRPHKGAIITYWNGLRLWWKGVPFYEHPRKENAAYREEALARNGKMVRLCPAFGGTNAANDAVLQRDEKIDSRFVWKDAKWPWSPSSSR